MSNSVYDSMDNIDDICQNNIKNMTNNDFYEIQVNNHNIREYIEGMHKNNKELDIKYKALTKLYRSAEFSIKQNEALDRASKIIEKQEDEINQLVDIIGRLDDVVKEQQAILDEYKKEIKFSSNLKYGEHLSKKDDADIVNKVLHYYEIDGSIRKVSQRKDTPSYPVCADIIHDNLK